MRLLVVLALGLSGCGAGIKTVQVHAPQTPSVAAMVVYPVRLTGEVMPEWRAFEVSERLATTVVGQVERRLPTFGPSEFRVMSWADESAWVGSTVLPQLVRAGVVPAQTVVLRVSVEKRVASSMHEARDAKGRARAASALEETTWVGRAEVLLPSEKTLLLELEGTVHTDPFQEATPDAEFDPAPGLTLVIERLAKEATKQVLAWAVDRQGPAPVVAVAESPALTAGFPDREVSAFDALTAEIWLQNRAKYLTPTLTDAEAGKVAKARPGLVVLRAPETAGVQVGDLITQVDGVPASTTVLARKRLALTPVQVRVRRGSQELDTTIP